VRQRLQTEMVLMVLLDFPLGRRSYAKIVEIYEEAKLDPPAHYAQSLRLLAAKAVSEASYYQEKFDQTEAYLRELVNISTTAWGWKSSQAISSMLKLEKCLNIQGESEEARETAGKVLRLSGVDFGWAGFYQMLQY
jgi:tetratricopeptide (TPR) repeat protein